MCNGTVNKNQCHNVKNRVSALKHQRTNINVLREIASVQQKISMMKSETYNATVLDCETKPNVLNQLIPTDPATLRHVLLTPLTKILQT